jgi:hypothetical protein
MNIFLNSETFTIKQTVQFQKAVLCELQVREPIFAINFATINIYFFESFTIIVIPKF